nr:hypothetical protein Iba_chr15aCG13150 [Ipomoea batatas]
MAYTSLATLERALYSPIHIGIVASVGRHPNNKRESQSLFCLAVSAVAAAETHLPGMEMEPDPVRTVPRPACPVERACEVEDFGNGSGWELGLGF